MNISHQDHIKALQWIVNLLRSHDIPFLVCGGLATIGYGAKRDLNDIDLFVPTEHFRRVVALGKTHISKPAQHYCEAAEGWDLEYVQFIYSGVKIEVGNPDSAKILDHASGRWVDLQLDFSSVEITQVFGIELPLIKQEELTAYKSKLARAVDQQDIRAMHPSD
ncbi:MAG: hypothetical protein P8163_20380 [Candidatus Thiodiazotropha sp.]